MSSTALYREFRISGKGAWDALVTFVRANAKAFIELGKPLRIIVTSEDKPRSVEQNARLWAIVTEISEQAWVNGRQYDKDTWYEMFARMYLPMQEIVLPTGEIVLRRKSTKDLKVGEFGEFMQKVEAYAGAELGIEIEG